MKAADKPPYFVEGWGKEWYVMSRNWRTVAKCPSKAWANKIAKLLIEGVEQTKDAVILRRVRACEIAEIDDVEHVLLNGHEHYLAHSLLEDILE